MHEDSVAPNCGAGGSRCNGGSLALVSRKERPAAWQFRWSEKDLHGARIQRKRVIGTVERYPDEAAAPSDWKYVVDNVIVYRDVYREGFCQPCWTGE
jgi:hypothetical protein